MPSRPTKPLKPSTYEPVPAASTPKTALKVRAALFVSAALAVPVVAALNAFPPRRMGKRKLPADMMLCHIRSTTDWHIWPTGSRRLSGARLPSVLSACVRVIIIIVFALSRSSFATRQRVRFFTVLVTLIKYVAWAYSASSCQGVCPTLTVYNTFWNNAPNCYNLFTDS